MPTDGHTTTTDPEVSEALQGAVDAAQAPSDDPEAPHGRDARGRPLAPFGLRVNGIPKKGPGGPRPLSEEAFHDDLKRATFSWVRELSRMSTTDRERFMLEYPEAGVRSAMRLADMYVDTFGETKGGTTIVQVQYIDEGTEAELDLDPPATFTTEGEAGRWMHCAFSACLSPSVIREQVQRTDDPAAHELLARMLRTSADNLETVAQELHPTPEPPKVPEDLLAAAARIAELEGLITTIATHYPDVVSKYAGLGVEAD